MKWKKITILTLIVSLLASLSGSLSALAAESSTTKTLNSAYIVYGAGTSTEARENIAKVLGSDSSFKTLTATAADYNTYIAKGSSETTDAAMISSVAIAPGDPGSGVKVNIKDYNGENNI